MNLYHSITEAEAEHRKRVHQHCKEGHVVDRKSYTLIDESPSQGILTESRDVDPPGRWPSQRTQPKSVAAQSIWCREWSCIWSSKGNHLTHTRCFNTSSTIRASLLSCLLPMTTAQAVCSRWGSSWLARRSTVQVNVAAMAFMILLLPNNMGQSAPVSNSVGEADSPFFSRSRLASFSIMTSSTSRYRLDPRSLSMMTSPS